VLVKTTVFRGDDGVLQIGRDLAKRNKGVPLVIRLAVYPGLQAAFDVHCRCWRVDPLCNRKQQRGKQP